MPLTDIQELLKEANKHIPDPDVIIDVYDMTYAWVSQKHSTITEYTKEEQINTRISEISQLKHGDTNNTAPEALTPNQKFTQEMILTTKSGKKKEAEVAGIVIEFNNQPYLIGKILKVTE